MRVMMIGALAMALGSSCVHADEQGRLATAREIVKISHAADNMRSMLPAIFESMRPMLKQKSAGDQKVVDDILGRATATFDAQVDAFVDLAAQVYAREFSDEDLANILAFDRTPTGQALIAKQPVIAKGMIGVGQRWGAAVAKQILDDVRKDAGKAPPAKL